MAICADGEIGLGHTTSETPVSFACNPLPSPTSSFPFEIITDNNDAQAKYWIYANNCNHISTDYHPGGVCGKYGNDIVDCDYPE